MNVKTLIAATAAILVAAPVLAQESPVFNDSYGTPKTRAEVKAELADWQQAQRDNRVAGIVNRGEAHVFVEPKTQLVRNRDAVAAEARMAVRDKAEIDAGDVVRVSAGEATVFVDQAPGQRSREEVRAEARDAIRVMDHRFPG